MLQIAKTSLILKRQLRKEDRNKVVPILDSNPFIENLAKYKIFSPRTLHKLLFLENSTWSDTMKPICKTVFGALLFADISGFTRLSAHLSAEELKFHINQYFSLLLGAVYEHYGDIIKFCGDAIIVMWPISDDSNDLVQQAAVELAIKCSLHLLQVCGQYDHKFENGSPVSLRLHCGVGCGKIHCMCLGDNDRWEFLISGDALTQVGAAESDAKIGEVCVSAEAFAHVAHLYPSSPQLASGNYLLDLQSFEDTHQEDVTTPNATGPFKMSAIATSPSPAHVPSHSPRRSKINSRFSIFPSSQRYRTTSEESVAENQQQHRTNSDELKPQFSLSFSLNLNNSKSQGTSSISLPSPLDHRSNPSIPSGRRNSFAQLMNQVAMAVVGANANQERNAGQIEGSTLRSGKPKGVSCRVNPRFIDVIYFLSLPSYLTPGPELTSSPPLLENQDSLSNNAIITKFAQLIRLFVPEAARTAIEHRSLSYLAELRVVVTTFIQILGLEEDFLHGRIERPQLVITIILSCLKRYGGSLRQYVVDDKGCVVILAFGLPGSSHEDNSIRAIETTARIRHLLNANMIDCKIGITQGRVYCGLVGSSDRCEYAMMGSSVNLAARFMSQAHLNTIIVSHEIYVQSSQEYEYETLPKMKAKGYVKPVAAYVPLHRVNNTSHGQHGGRGMIGKIGENHEKRDGFRFVGRDSELSILTTAFDEFCRHGGRSLFTITGGPGVGKSWLLSKFLHYATSSSTSAAAAPPSNENPTMMTMNLQIYSVVADEYHSNSKYFCLRQLLDQIISHDEQQQQQLNTAGSPNITTTTNILHNYSASCKGGGGGGSEMKTSRSRPHGGGGGTGGTKRAFGHSYSAVCAGSGGSGDGGELTLQYEYKLFNWITKHAPQLRLKDLDIDPNILIDLEKNESLVSSGEPSLASPQFNTREHVRPYSQHEPSSTSGANGTSANGNSGVSDFFSLSFSRETLMSEAVTCIDCILPIQSQKFEVTNISSWVRMKICIGIILKIFELCFLKKSSILTIENLHWCDASSLEILMKLLFNAELCFTIATFRTLSIEPNSRQKSSFRKNSDSLLIHSHRILEKLKESNYNKNGGVGGNPSVGDVGGNTSVGGVGGNTSVGVVGIDHLTNLNRYILQYLEISQTCAVHPLSLNEIKIMLEDVISERLFQTYPDILKISTLTQILMRTGGSPYLVSVFILSLRETLLNGTYKNIDILPSGEHNIIVNRFDKLTSSQQLILKVASVIGNEFTCDFLSNVLMNIGEGEREGGIGSSGGHDILSSRSGLELTLEQLLSTTLITSVSSSSSTSHGNGNGSDDDEYFMRTSIQSHGPSLFASAHTSSPPHMMMPILSNESNSLGEGGGGGGGSTSGGRNSGDNVIDISTTSGGGIGTGTGTSHHSPPIKFYKFTTKTVEECIYNLMLRSQKETSHNAVALVMENLCGILPILYFDEIAKHVYSSNNIPKKILYLEESLRRAIYQDNLLTMKDTLQRLFHIATGLSAEGILHHCCSVRHGDGGSTSSVTSSTSSGNHHERNFPILTKSKKLKSLSVEIPVSTIWLNESDILRNFPISPSVTLPPSHGLHGNGHGDPFYSLSSKSFFGMDASMRAGGGEGEEEGEGAPPPVTTTVPTTSRSIKNGISSSSTKGIPHQSPSSSSLRTSRLLEEQDIYLWLLKFASVHFRLGNFKIANNFIMLGLKCFGFSPISVELTEDITHYRYRFKVWSSNYFQKLPNDLPEDALHEIIHSYAILAQIYLLRGYTAAADSCLQRVTYLRKMTSKKTISTFSSLSPSSFFSSSLSPSSSSFPSSYHIHLQGLTALLMSIHHQAPTEIILHHLTSSSSSSSIGDGDPSQSHSNYFIGLNFIYQALIEFSSCQIQNAFLSTNHALSFYQDQATESILLIYLLYVIQGWLHLFSGNSLEASRVSEIAYQYHCTSTTTARTHLLPPTLLKWSIEIKILSKIFSLNFHEAYVEWEKLKGYSKRDAHSATSSAIVSFILIHLKGYDTAFLHSKYASLRLIQKPHTSPMSCLFLFLTIYSNLKIIDYCKMLIDPHYASRRISFSAPSSSAPFSSSSSSSQQQLVGWDIMTSKMSIERARTAVKVLTPYVLEGMKAMKKAVESFPIALVFYHTLLILQIRTECGHGSSSSSRSSSSSGGGEGNGNQTKQKIDFENLKIQLEKFQSFKFGMAYYHRERGLTLLEYGEKYRVQAQQAEDLSNRLFRDSTLSGNTGGGGNNSLRFANNRSLRQGGGGGGGGGGNIFNKESEDEDDSKVDDDDDDDDKGKEGRGEEQDEVKMISTDDDEFYQNSQSHQLPPLKSFSDSSSFSSSSKKEFMSTEELQSSPITPTDEISSFVQMMTERRGGQQQQQQLDDLIEESMTNLSNSME